MGGKLPCRLRIDYRIQRKTRTKAIGPLLSFSSWPFDSERNGSREDAAASSVLPQPVKSSWQCPPWRLPSQKIAFYQIALQSPFNRCNRDPGGCTYSPYNLLVSTVLSLLRLHLRFLPGNHFADSFLAHFISL